MRVPSSIFGLLVLLLALGTCRTAAAQGGEADRVQPIYSKVFSGKVYCRSLCPVVTSFSGEVVEKKVKMGQYVEKGDVLLKVALLDKDWYSLNKRVDKELPILNAEMEISTLKRQIALNEKRSRDTDRLIAEGMASEQAGKDIESEIEFLKLKLGHAEKVLTAIMSDFAKEKSLLSNMLGREITNRIPKAAFVTAPVSGYVVWEKFNLRVGTFTAGKVFEIGEMNPIIIRTQLYEADASQIKTGDEAEVILELDPKEIMKAVVSSISWLPVDEKVDTPSYYMVELELPNPGNALKEGYKVRVSFPNAGRGAVQ